MAVIFNSLTVDLYLWACVETRWRAVLVSGLGPVHGHAAARHHEGGRVVVVHQDLNREMENWIILIGPFISACPTKIWALQLQATKVNTLSILRVGHSDIFDINVPGFFFKIWYQCPNSCPTFLTQILSLYDMKLRITITWIVEFFSYCVYFMWKQYWFHQIHTTKLGLGEAVWEKCFCVPLGSEFWYQVSQLMAPDFDIVPL